MESPFESSVKGLSSIIGLALEERRLLDDANGAASAENSSHCGSWSERPQRFRGEDGDGDDRRDYEIIGRVLWLGRS